MPDNAARTIRQGRVGIVRAMLLLVRGYNAAKNLWSTVPIWTVKHDKDMEPCEDMNDKSKPALSLVTPQARHHFTLAHQVNQLVGASEADPEMGFMTRLMALCSLPRTNPGDRLVYRRVNGPYRLYIQAGPETQLPYGNLPRLLLAWVCTEAVRTQNRVLILGSSLSEFMRTLGIYHNSAGKGGVQTRLRNQMERLFHCQIELIYEDERGTRFVASRIADGGEFWWNPKHSAKRSLWKSKLELGREVFQRNHPAPGPSGHKHSQCAQTFVARSGSLHVASVPDLCPHTPAATLLD